MPTLEDGFRRAIAEGTTGLIISLIINSVLKSMGYEWLAIVFNLLSIISIILFFNNIKYWSIAYLFGWLCSLILIGQYIYDWWEWPLYIIVGLIFLGIKLSNKFNF
jgi:hypothetical protein